MKVAMVVQRYGEEVGGGAEQHARWLAERLQALAQVTVFTTCAVDYQTWANSYPAGTSSLNGVTIHRFPVDRARDWARFQQLSGAVARPSAPLSRQLAWMAEQGPFSTPLFAQIEDAYPHYDAFIFVTYLYAHTYYGLPLVSDKAVLVPTAHDEPYLYLPLMRPLFHLPRVIVYNTATEKRMVNRITRNGYRQNDAVAGVGINVPETASASRFRAKFGIEGNFLLYVGRIDAAKNVPALLDDYLRYQATRPESPPLVLIGKPHFPLPDDAKIIWLGFVSEQDKFDAMRAATVFLMPSLYESLSMVTLEAWLMARPVLVNGQCEVLKQQCRDSDGGLYYSSYDEFAALLDLLLARPDLRTAIGEQGRSFAVRQYSWDAILAQYREILARFTAA
jgi:glycosyltransferase involved in cell wall biosynthesis